ncbi:MAG: lipoprotein [Giesbergeria sp.]|nr:lipoprotein [Giesbergeria sp.]
MLRASQILVSPIILAVSMAGLSACGQRGPLYLPTEPAAAQRASLPQTLNSLPSQAPAQSTPASSAKP